MKPFYKEGWVVGDGSKFYMADFYVGTIWTDILNNPKTWMTKAEIKAICDKFPEFVAYGARFDAENKKYLDMRPAVYKGNHSVEF